MAQDQLFMVIHGQPIGRRAHLRPLTVAGVGETGLTFPDALRQSR